MGPETPFHHMKRWTRLALLATGANFLSNVSTFLAGRPRDRDPRPIRMTNNRLLRYSLALLALLLAVAVRWFLDPILNDQAPTVTMYAAVAVAAILGGFRLALPAAIIGFLACAWLFLPPRGQIDLTTARNLISLIAYLSICGVVIALAELRRIAQRKLEEHQRGREQWSPYAPLSLNEMIGSKAFRDPILVAFVFAFAVVVIGGLAGFQSTKRLVRNERLVAHTNEVIADLDELLSTAKDAETGQRGFLITRNEIYLQPYSEATARLPKQLEGLRRTLSDNVDQLGRLAELERVLTQKMEELQGSIDRVRVGDSIGALGLVRDNRGLELMESARRRVAEMQVVENELLLTRGTESRESLRITMLSILLTAGMGGALLVAVFLLTQRSLRERQRSAEVLRDQRERFRVTLASIGDGVITTDINANITYLNAVAEQVSGWSLEQATGKHLDQIFRIINETTRLPVPNPAYRALQEGVVIGLANHTILIRRDESEVAIDDSAAPIRDEQGNVAGCVLIFRDISDRRLVEMENLRQVDAARFLVSIIESSEDAIIGVSLDGMIQTWNNAAERLYHYSTSEAVGHPITMLIPNDRKDEEDRLIARILKGERISHFDTVRCNKEGHSIPVSLTISPVRDNHGEIVGTSKIVRDITEAKEAERRIYTLMKELREADTRKDEFLAILAHELRGPLAPIRHRLEILKLSGDNPPLRNESIQKVDQQVLQLVRLVDDLLDVSRITRNKLELRRETLELGDVLNQAVEIARPLAESRNHKVIVSVPMQSMKVEADPVRLAQIFGNLLGNAHKYSDDGATIWLSVERVGDDVKVSVRDSGPGIAADLLPRVFDLFTQGRGQSERTQGGLGIGLTLVKQLVTMHGGTVEARSEGAGKGSEFIVWLPLELGKPKSGSASAALAVPVTPARRVLVVDDNAETAESLVMLLKLLGHETELAFDGVAAIEVAEQFQPDIMLLDIGLPKLNGYEVATRIRQETWGDNILLAAVSGWGQDLDRQKSAEAGFDLHMVKPLDYTRLLQVLAEGGRRKSG